MNLLIAAVHFNLRVFTVILKKHSCRQRKNRPKGRKRVRILIWVLLVPLLGACSETMRQRLFEERQLVVVGTSAHKKEQERKQLQKALENLRSGRLNDAQALLNDLSNANYHSKLVEIRARNLDGIAKILTSKKFIAFSLVCFVLLVILFLIERI